MAKVARRQISKSGSSSDRYVVPNSSSGGWDIIKAGHRRATGHAKTKDEAIRNARRIVRNEGGGELRIVNKFGKLTDTATIPPSKRRAA
jgi:Uncharacterized protein conserved in bacteria (DUF2188)